MAWAARPIDPPKVMRELDALMPSAARGAPPRACTPATGAEVAPSAPPAPRAAPGPHGALLVDASAAAADLLSSRLRSWGLAVECVFNSSQAIERLAGRRYDFVFIDVELAGDSDLDGLSLCQHIKRSHPRPASSVVMVSAQQSELGRVRGALAGCDAYLGKPPQEVELARLLLRHGLQAPPPAAVIACAHPA
jgi:CheY-like chemotaxis protein